MDYILSLSYGKDSLACLGAIEQLGWQLDRIVHAEVWATDTIPADLPPMVEFKAKADAIIKERCGIEVEHIRAKRWLAKRYRKDATGTRSMLLSQKVNYLAGGAGPLNPEWVEWLMGFPIGWTELSVSETPSSQRNSSLSSTTSG